MSVAHDKWSESHTGTTGSASQASFSWTHTPVGTPKGVLVFVFTNADASDVTSVTYGGVSVPAVTGGEAADTLNEPGRCKAFFLGSGIPTGAQSVVVNRVNNADVMYAVAASQTASGDTEYHGVFVEQENQALTEENVDDGSPGTDSLRYMAVNSGLGSPPITGANTVPSTSESPAPAIDYGARTAKAVRESVAGQGARPVGCADAADDVAAVYLAVREVAATPLDLDLGDIPATSSVNGVDLSASGPLTLSLGDVPSAAVVRGIDLGFTALDLDLGDIPSTEVVNGVDLALSPAYTPTTWVDGSAPALDETNLNKLADELGWQAGWLDIAETLPTWADGVRPYLTEAAPWNEMERVCEAVATALGLSYTPTDWLTGWSPARNADNLNRLEQQAATNRDAANGIVEMLPVFVGETAFYELNTDGGNDGNLLANAVELESRYGTCTLQSLSIRVVNAAGNLILGLYDDDGPSGGPGTLLATTAEFAPSAGWNTEPVLSEVDLDPGTYWIAHQPDDAALTYGAMNVVAASNEARWYAHSGALPSTFSASPTSGDARWAVYATFASTTDTKPADPAAPSPPSQASAEGFTTLAFQDEFEWYDREKWADHPFWGEAPPADSIYISSPSVVALNSQKADGSPDVHLAAREIISGGNEQTFQFGYFEARMKWNVDEGILPAFWLSSLANALNANWPSDPPEGVLNAEIDVIEAQYDDAQLYYGTLHENTGETYGGGHVDNTAGGTYDAGVDLDAGFHTYGCLWTASEVTWFFDDVEVLTTAPFADTDQPQFILLSMMPNNTWTGDPANAVGDLITEVDWVRIWQ